MADLGGTFDPGAVKDDREILPTGDYLAQVFESDLKDTKNGTGKYLVLGWEIVSGALSGRKLWVNVNVQNANAQAQDIGQRELKRICEAVGVGPIRNSEDLHFKPCMITVGIEKGEGQYADKNNIKGYKFYGPPSSAPSAPAAQQQQAPASSGVPWPTR